MCVYEEAYKKQLNEKLQNLCSERKGYCPWNGSPCDICSGLEEALVFECYKCNKCKLYE